MHLSVQFQIKMLLGLLLFAAWPLIAQQNITASLIHEGLERQFIVHLPPGYPGNEAVPAVITLHGGSGNYQSVQGFTQMNLASNQNGFIVIYPQGAGIAPPGFSWADGRGTSADAANIDDVGFISTLIDTVGVDYNIDLNRVYVCGYSNGGFMTQRLACEMSERFAAVGGLGCSMNTFLFQTCAPATPIPMMYVSGTNDPEVPYLGGTMNNPNVTPIVPVDTAVQFWVEHNNCQQSEPLVELPNLVETDSSTVELLRFTDCDCNAEVAFYRVVNGGHTWPGVPISQFPQLGNTNEDIHASFELWSFFENFSKCETANSIGEIPKQSGIRVFPNPANTLVQIKAEKAIAEIQIFNSAGQWVGSSNHSQLDVSILPLGIYFLQVQLEREETAQWLRLVRQ